MLREYVPNSGRCLLIHTEAERSQTLYCTYLFIDPYLASIILKPNNVYNAIVGQKRGEAYRNNIDRRGQNLARIYLLSHWQSIKGIIFSALPMRKRQHRLGTLLWSFL